MGDVSEQLIRTFLYVQRQGMFFGHRGEEAHRLHDHLVGPQA